ncbi:MAG: hypothetical protein LH480_13010 [Rubrivivax sp.]|nr:hypothetical protein [Rubrivivax sp.]
MTDGPQQRALAAATLALLVALTCIALFLPPLAQHTLATAWHSALTALALAAALLLHWVFLGVAARRMARSVVGWTSLSVLLFPVGSVVALILLDWLRDEQQLPHDAAAQAG